MEKILTVCVDEDDIPSNFWWHHNLTFENFTNTNPPHFVKLIIYTY